MVNYLECRNRIYTNHKYNKFWQVNNMKSQSPSSLKGNYKRKNTNWKLSCEKYLFSKPEDLQREIGINTPLFCAPSWLRSKMSPSVPCVGRVPGLRGNYMHHWWGRYLSVLLGVGPAGRWLHGVWPGGWIDIPNSLILSLLSGSHELSIVSCSSFFIVLDY